MSRIRLLHWNASEAVPVIQELRSAGHQVEYDEKFTSALMKAWRESPPAAFVIDLTRLPSHGRELAIALRNSKATRQVPLVFLDGDPAKVERIRSELPDASFCTHSTLRSTLKRALAAPPPENPAKPVQMMDRYGSRTAAQKLGIKESSIVAAIEPPRDFPALIGTLPRGVELVENDGSSADVTLCFIHSADSLAPALSRLRRAAATSKLWILWRKGGSSKNGGVTEKLIRDHALDLGLVDYKICSVNSVWSAILFAARK